MVDSKHCIFDYFCWEHGWKLTTAKAISFGEQADDAWENKAQQDVCSWLTF